MSMTKSVPAAPASLPKPWRIPLDWPLAIRDEFRQAYMCEIANQLDRERRLFDVVPEDNFVFNAFQQTRWTDLRVVILGQDPYHGPGRAHGLSFSVPVGVALPPSLKNIVRELRDDLGIPEPEHGCLIDWARQGILLLNATLTVRLGQPNSHQHVGWQQLTDQVLKHISELKPFCVFVLWGRIAAKKSAIIDARHATLVSAHPSPLSARNGFFGSRVFSAATRH